MIYVRANPESELYKLQMFLADKHKTLFFFVCVISYFEIFTECRNVFVFKDRSD